MCLSYGIGALGVSLLNETPAFFLNPFLLRIGQIPSSWAGTMLLIGKIFDALTDPAIGNVTDKVRTRFGRRRPFILVGGPMAAIANILLWQSFEGMESQAGRFAYYLVCYCTMTFSLSLFFIPYSALTMEMSALDGQRVRLTKYRVVFMFVGMIVGAAAVGLLLSFLAENEEDLEGEARAYRLGAFLVSLLVVSSTTLCFLGVREVDYAHVALERNAISFFKGLRLVFLHRPYLLLTGFSVLGWASSTLVQNNLLFYSTYSIDLYDYFAYSLILVLLTTILFIPLWGIVVQRKGKKFAAFLGLSTLLLLYATLVVLPPQNVPLFFAVSFFAGIGMAAINLLPWVFFFFSLLSSFTSFLTSCSL